MAPKPMKPIFIIGIAPRDALGMRLGRICAASNTGWSGWRALPQQRRYAFERIRRHLGAGRKSDPHPSNRKTTSIQSGLWSEAAL